MPTLRAPLWLTLLALLACPLPAAAQKYPERSIRLVVAFTASGSMSILALLISEKLRKPLGQPVVADFRPGAGENLAAELAARAPADGYTLLLTSPAIAISPSVYRKLGYDGLRDFAPISAIATVPNVMTVHPSVPARSLAELVKLAKAHPGKLNFGSSGLGSSNQLGSELFKTVAKINIVHVPYKGSSFAMTAMISGEVDMVVSSVPATISYINSGRLRGIAVLAPERVAALPQVPTTAEAGMPELVLITWYGVFAPAGVKPGIVERLNAEIATLMHTPEMKSQLAKFGLDAATYTPGEFAKFARPAKLPFTQDRATCRIVLPPLNRLPKPKS